MSGLFAVNDLRRACLAAARSKRVEKEVAQYFQAPAFFLDNNRLGFYTGVEKETWECHFLLPLAAAQQLVSELEDKLACDLSTAEQAIAAAPRHNWAKYDSCQIVTIPTELMYTTIMKSFAKLSKQSKSQALYSECQLMLSDATSMAQPLPSQQLQQYRGPDREQATMFLSLDFEWWEKSHDYILEVGYSLWDNVTRRHRTRHWVIRENLNKCNGRFVTDNRMRFLFGSSDKGSLDAAMTALQKEVDDKGITDGLTRQEQAMLRKADVRLVLVGHGMDQDLEQAESEIEWPTDMPMMDTQKLYLAHQLKQLDAASAAEALEAVVGQKEKKEHEAAPLLGDDDDLGLESESDDEQLLVPVQQDADHGDNDLAGVRKGVAGMSLKGSKGGLHGSDVDASGLILVKTKQLQLPKKVRPWPAGPATEDEKPAEDECAPQKEKEKLDRQIGLAGLLSALGIKASKLHNAGNDARFTMEAFLAMSGHPACPDPVQAHIDSLNNDDRYQKEIEESLMAAAAQGWGTPSSTGKGATPASTSGTTTPTWGAAPAAAVSAGLSRLAHSSTQAISRPSSAANGSDCGSMTSSDGMSAPPGFAPKRHPAVPPGFSVLGTSRNHPAVPPGSPAAADDDVPPGFGAKPCAPAPAPAPANSWASKLGGNTAGSSNAWGRGPPAAAPAGVAASGTSISKPGNAWGRGPAAAAAAPPAKAAGAWPAASAKTSGSTWREESASAGGGGGGWGAGKQQQDQGGFAARNSSVMVANAAVVYEPNPDGW